MILDERTRRTLAATTRFGDIRELAEVDSTNRYLLALARGGAPEGVVVVADYQSAGRGRRDRTWEAPPGGGLLMSILLRPPWAAVAPEQRWLVTAAVAVAASDACRHVAGVVPDIKWPNDLLLGDRKLAGILAEADAGAIVVGVGMNVASAPPGAASLGASVDRGQLLAGLLSNLEFGCQNWDQVEAAYRDRCATVGRRVRVVLPGRTVVGQAVAVDPDGRLCVVAGEEVLHLSVADVIHVIDP